MNAYSVVIIRTRQILATGLTQGQARQQSRAWNRQSIPEDCATWEPAPSGVRLAEIPPVEEEEPDRDSYR